MALDKITKPRARWATFKSKLAGAVTRFMSDKFKDYGVSVKDYGAIGDGVANDTVAIKTAISHWMNSSVIWRGRLLFPQGTYKMTEPFYIPEGTTVFGEIYGEGLASIDFDFTDNYYKNCVEFLSVRELQVTNMWFRYNGTVNIPECGLLEARIPASGSSSGDIFSGRHRYKHMRVTGNFTRAAYFNYATEEMYYENCQFRNYNYDKTTGKAIGNALIITSTNTQGASSEFKTLIDYKQSTTVFSFLNPKFDQSGYDDTTATAWFDGAIGITISGGYMQSNGLCNILLDASNGSCGNFSIKSSQFEQSRKDTENPLYKNHNYSIVLRANNASLPYPSSSHNNIEVNGLAEFGNKSMLLDNVRTLTKSNFKMSRDIESTFDGATSTLISMTDFDTNSVVNLSAIKKLADVGIHSTKYGDITVPTVRANTVRLMSNDAPHFTGDMEDSKASNDGVITATYGNIKVTNPATNITTLEFLTGTPVHGHKVYICSASTEPISIEHNTGNIYTQDGATLTPKYYTLVTLTWNNRANKWIASV